MNLFLKDLFRTIRHSFGRFLAIAGICALGIGFFAGLQSTCWDMKFTATQFYNNTNMMDFRIVCSLGLSDENVEAIKTIEDVDGVMPAYETDILTNFGSDQCAVRLHSLSSSAYDSKCVNSSVVLSDDNNYINRPILINGDWPKNTGECVLCSDAITNQTPEIGDEIDILESSTDLDKSLKAKKLKVTGFVKSAYYIDTVQMGFSTLGPGRITQFAYVSDSTFADDFPYTEIFVTTKNSKKYISGTDDYQNYIDSVSEKIEELAPGQIKVRTAAIKNDAQTKIDEAKNQLEEGKKKADEELSNNENKLKSSYNKIANGQKEIDKSKKEIEEAYVQLYAKKDSAMKEIYSAKDKINNVISENNKFKILHSKNIKDIENNNKLIVDSIDTSLNGLSAIIKNIDESVSINQQLRNFIISYITDQAKRKSIEELLDLELSALNEFKNICSEFEYSMKHSVFKKVVYYSRIIPYKISYAGSYKAISSLNILFNEIDSMLTTMYNEILAKEKQANEEFNKIEYQIKQGEIQIKNAQEDLLNGKIQYQDGLNQYNIAKQQVMSKLEESEKKISESQDKINEIKDALFFVMDRTKNFGAITFDNDAERMANIANVFPLIFFFVAVLVALTSMTRMIEEERVLIGTYKALGFSRSRITIKYLLYTFLSSFIGGIIGILLLCQFLPWVIMYAYSILYKCTIPLPMPYDFNIAVISLFIGIAVTMITTIFAAIKTLSLQPAVLIVPSSPKAGKRIFLEYIRPLWNILNFNWKITFRNMFLYKKRLFMTLIGIAGCTALLLTGFGLHDSISDIIDKQFDDIMFDNFKITFTEEPNRDNIDEIESKLKDVDKNSESTLTHEDTVMVMIPGHPDTSVSIVVPKNIKKFESLRMLRDMSTKQNFSFKDDEVYVSIKIANMLKLHAGDEITVYNQDDIGNAGEKEYHLHISGVVENYIAHYIYMSESTYKKYFHDKCKFNNLISKVSLDKPGQNDLVNSIRDLNYVKSEYFTDSNRDNYSKMLSSVNMIVVVLIISAAALAFVVLYNLININICERKREIATLKVLGMKSGEINMYVHRETILLSLMGTILGVFLGFILENFVIVSAEVDYVMFGRNIYWWSILMSILVTLVFSVIVAICMRKKLYSISMVESLKSVE